MGIFHGRFTVPAQTPSMQYIFLHFPIHLCPSRTPLTRLNIRSLRTLLLQPIQCLLLFPFHQPLLFKIHHLPQISLLPSSIHPLNTSTYPTRCTIRLKALSLTWAQLCGLGCLFNTIYYTIRVQACKICISVLPASCARRTVWCYGRTVRGDLWLGEFILCGGEPSHCEVLLYRAGTELFEISNGILFYQMVSQSPSSASIPSI